MARSTKVQGFLDTLRRIPDDVVLSTMTRDLDLGNPHRCLCGWAVRESIARATNRRAENVGTSEVWYTPDAARHRFGGGYEEWRRLYYGACNHNAPSVERALALRVEEAVNA